MALPGRTDVLLLAGMAAGVWMAAAGLSPVRSAPPPWPGDDVVAMVGDVAVSRADLDTAVALVERDRERACTPEERDRILQRLVDEELLVQRGLELGLPSADRKLRADLVSAMLDAATSATAAAEPDEDELQAFIDDNRAPFEAPPSLRVAQVFVASSVRGDDQARRLAEQAATRLRAGDDVADVRRELADPPPLELPDALLPASRLGGVVGPAAAEAALALAQSEVSDPVRGADGYRVLVMIERGATPSATLAENRDAVVAEYRRRAAERAVADYLAELRSQTPVRVRP